jgi:hypothetical protein
MSAICGRASATLAVTVVMLVLAATATAAPPIREESPPTHVSFPAGAFCSFGVTIDSVSNGLFTITQVDSEGNLRWIFGAGRNVLRVTNDATDESIVVNAGGPGKIVPQPDGSLVIEGRGPWLFGFFPTDTPSHELLLLTGNFEVRVAPDGTLTLLSHVGPPPRDLCTELS